MSDSELNLDGVQFERVRKIVDAPFRALADELEVAYYKNWKLGKSSDFRGWDPIANPSQGEAKVVFDRLHGQIWRDHEIALIKANASLDAPYPEDKINPIDSNGKRRIDRLRQANEKERIPSFTAEALASLAK